MPTLQSAVPHASLSHLPGAGEVSGVWRDGVGPSMVTRTTGQLDARLSRAPAPDRAKAGDYIRLSLIRSLIDISVLWFGARPAPSRHVTARARRGGQTGVYWAITGVGNQSGTSASEVADCWWRRGVWPRRVAGWPMEHSPPDGKRLVPAVTSRVPDRAVSVVLSEICVTR